MRCFILAAALVLACEPVHAQDLSKDLTNLRFAQATTTPQAAPAPAAPAPQVAPAPQAAPQASPAAQAAPDTAAPTAQPSRPVKRKQTRRRETDEEKARRIAAKYGVSW